MVTQVQPVELRIARVRSGMSLRAVARKLRKSAPYISDIELGRRNCTREILEFYEKLVGKSLV